MSESYPEHRPLLSGGLSDEEAYSPHFSRRLHINRGRSRNRLKGAARILTRWPDHWGSFLAYWWVGLGMICLMTFIIYNSVFVFPMIQSVNSKAVGSERIYPIVTTPHVAPLSRNMYMHLFVDQNEEVNLNDYIPYIEKVSTKYVAFDFHLIILLNVTNMKDLSAEMNNEIALNSLWDDDNNVKKESIKRSNINIEYISLTTYMDNSPMKKYWKNMPRQHVKFLARAVSIWNRGGVAFNPDILTPRSPHAIYAEKLRKILNKFKNTQSKYDFFHKESSPMRKFGFESSKMTQNVNNIRDIIDALESKDDSTSIFSRELVEAEDKDLPIITRYERENHKVTKKIDLLNNSQISTKNPYDSDANHINVSSPYSSLSYKNDISGTRLLPSFLKFLFHFKPSNKTEPTEMIPIDKLLRVPKSVIDRQKHTKNTSMIKSMDSYRPVIISAKEMNINQSVSDDDVTNMAAHNYPKVEENFDANRLTIDLRGNIIATDTACHAFLGTMFSNAPHHIVEETVTDFIIAELTNFCKGLLSSCMGIDVILL